MKIGLAEADGGGNGYNPQRMCLISQASQHRHRVMCAVAGYLALCCWHSVDVSQRYVSCALRDVFKVFLVLLIAESPSYPLCHM